MTLYSSSMKRMCGKAVLLTLMLSSLASWVDGRDFWLTELVVVLSQQLRSDVLKNLDLDRQVSWILVGLGWSVAIWYLIPNLLESLIRQFTKLFFTKKNFDEQESLPTATLESEQLFPSNIYPEEHSKDTR